MIDIQRRSPITFSARPVRTECRDRWTVVLEYDNEGAGPWLIDLSHRPKWDLQDRDISQVISFGISMPQRPGTCRLGNGILLNRMNETRASIWHLKGEIPAVPEGSAYTETTEAYAFLALAGKSVCSITEKLTSLDLADPGGSPPFLLQGPLSHVPCQVVVLERDGVDGIVLLTCSRGYGHDMVYSILEAGKEFGLRPAGENAFKEAMNS
jgi:hypothetical protein